MYGGDIMNISQNQNCTRANDMLQVWLARLNILQATDMLQLVYFSAVYLWVTSFLTLQFYKKEKDTLNSNTNFSHPEFPFELSKVIHKFFPAFGLSNHRLSYNYSAY